MSISNLSSLLRRHPELDRLYSQVRVLQQLQQLLDNHLPQPLAGHCRVAALDQEVLTLHTDSPAWAAKLRFQTADVLKIVRDNGTFGSINTIRVKARPPESKPPAPVPGAQMSPNTARLLRDIAASIEDPELRASLLRLSEN